VQDHNLITIVRFPFCYYNLEKYTFETYTEGWNLYNPQLEIDRFGLSEQWDIIKRGTLFEGSSLPNKLVILKLPQNSQLDLFQGYPKDRFTTLAWGSLHNSSPRLLLRSEKNSDINQHSKLLKFIADICKVQILIYDTGPKSPLTVISEHIEHESLDLPNVVLLDIA